MTKVALKVTFQDGDDCINSIEMILTEYPQITCDGGYMLFTDDNGTDYKVNTADFFGVEAFEWNI